LATWLAAAVRARGGELSPAERAIHIAKRKAIYERMHPETKRDGDRKSAKARSKSQVGTLVAVPAFIDDTSQKTGRSRTSVARKAGQGKGRRNGQIGRWVKAP